MNYKTMLVSILLAGPMQHAWGMDDVNKKAEELRKRIQNTIQEMEQEAQAKADAVSSFQALIGPHSQIIASEPEFAEVREKMPQFHEALEECKKYKIGVGTIAAKTATSLTKDFEIAMQQYQARINNKN